MFDKKCSMANYDFSKQKKHNVTCFNKKRRRWF